MKYAKSVPFTVVLWFRVKSHLSQELLSYYSNWTFQLYYHGAQAQNNPCRALGLRWFRI